MNLTSIITRDEPVGGLEVSDSRVRAAIYAKATKKSPARAVLAEEAIPQGAIEGGKVKDGQALAKAIRAVLSKLPESIPYFVVSIPPHAAYFKTISFPSSVDASRIDEAIRLSLSFHLPYKPEDVYLDYEILPTGKNEAFVCACPREVIDGYVAALKAAGIKPVAAETHPLSIARATKATGPLLISLPYKDGVSVAAIEGTAVRFSRSLPSDRLSTEQDVAREIERIEGYCKTEFSSALKRSDLESLALKDDIAPLVPAKQRDAKWLCALGALSRGRMPRGTDNIVSLLPVGTEDAYVFQQAVAFGAFVRNISIGISLFFIAAFVGAFAIITSLQARFTQEFAALSVQPTSSEILQEEERAKEFNKLIEATSKIASESTVWSAAIEEIKSKVTSGIVVTSLSLGAPEDRIQITGLAKTRAELTALKKSFESSEALSDVVLPLTNLELRADIPFTITFALKDPSSIYFQ
ncbi:MAG: pilus assembly protein PilM [Candidatus Taylorbacteria bacterium]|nr:pilus assembly protein PilM [Candidatus Taylorbacteria bacterium]